MAVSKRWHIALSSTEASRPVNLSIPKRFGLFLLSLAVIFMITFCISIGYIVYNHSKIARANDILLENDLLRDRLYTISTEMDSIMLKLQLMEDWEDKIRSDENFKSISKEIRELGVGGIPQVDSTFLLINNELNLEYNLTGWRKHPITGKRSFHYGLDFGNKTGSPIYATADGIVQSVKRHKYLGKYLTISHNFGYQTKYGHLHKVLVKQGESVKRGQIVALMGNSGRSTGSHLHYEVLRYSKHRNPYDYLNKLEDDIILSKQ